MECAERYKQPEKRMRCGHFQNAQPSCRFRMDIHTTATSLGKSECVTQRQNNRPSVIYFHGRLDKDSAGNRVEILNTRFEKECPSPTDNRTRNAVNENVTDSSRHEENDCRKRHRTSFNNFQLKRLEEEFEADNYIIGMKRWRLSEELEIPEKQIKIWYQNRRTKFKKHIV